MIHPAPRLSQPPLAQPEGRLVSCGNRSTLPSHSMLGRSPRPAQVGRTSFRRPDFGWPQRYWSCQCSVRFPQDSSQRLVGAPGRKRDDVEGSGSSSRLQLFLATARPGSGGVARGNPCLGLGGATQLASAVVRPNVQPSAGLGRLLAADSLSFGTVGSARTFGASTMFQAVSPHTYGASARSGWGHGKGKSHFGGVASTELHGARRSAARAFGLAGRAR